MIHPGPPCLPQAYFLTSESKPTVGYLDRCAESAQSLRYLPSPACQFLSTGTVVSLSGISSSPSPGGAWILTTQGWTTPLLALWVRAALFPRDSNVPTPKSPEASSRTSS